jgi:type IV secretion system protein VirB5
MLGMLVSGYRAQAIIPVTDVGAIIQLIQQVEYWKLQIEAMKAQLDQLHATFDALTGPRGMEVLAGMTVEQRNYLPPEAQALLALANGGGGGYAGIAAQVAALIKSQAIVSDERLAGMSEGDRAVIERGRSAAALIQVVSQTAYQHTSERFAALQGLIDAIATAPDAKAIADLQARIGAEEAMLQNEQNKLQMVASIAQAQAWSNEQSLHEQVIAGHGQFGDRFEPVAP